MTDNNAKQEVNAYLQNLEDTGFFKEDKTHHQTLKPGNVTVLPNGMTTEVISLSEQGMTITEYLQALASSGNAPATVLISAANGDLVRSATPTATQEQRLEASPNTLPGGSQSMRVTVNEMVTDNDVLLFRNPQTTQSIGVGIMEEMHKLFCEVK